MKKTLVIIILLAVAVYIAWKNDLFGTRGLSQNSDVNLEPVDTGSINAIVSQTSMTPTEKEYCSKLANNIGKAAKRGEGWSLKTLKESAVKNGVTYEQQLVLSALWIMYSNKGIISRDYCAEIADQIKNM